MLQSGTRGLDHADLYSFQISSDPENIREIETFIEKIRDIYGLEESIYHTIMTCLSEAVMNAIVHGNKNEAGKMVSIKLDMQNGKNLVFTVEDEGEGFDHSQLPNPTHSENLERLNGRGVFIMKELANTCIFNTKGNQVELHFC